MLSYYVSHIHIVFILAIENMISNTGSPELWKNCILSSAEFMDLTRARWDTFRATLQTRNWQDKQIMTRASHSIHSELHQPGMSANACTVYNYEEKNKYPKKDKIGYTHMPIQHTHFFKLAAY